MQKLLHKSTIAHFREGLGTRLYRSSLRATSHTIIILSPMPFIPSLYILFVIFKYEELATSAYYGFVLFVFVLYFVAVLAILYSIEVNFTHASSQDPFNDTSKPYMHCL